MKKRQPFTKEFKLEDAVEIEVEDNRLVIHPATTPRADWGQAFAEMAKRGDDKLLGRGALKPTEWDKREWHW